MIYTSQSPHAGTNTGPFIQYGGQSCNSVSYVIPLYTRRDAKKCPLHAQNEHMMASLSSFGDKV